jgi:hypothetical protein
MRRCLSIFVPPGLACAFSPGVRAADRGKDLRSRRAISLPVSASHRRAVKKPAAPDEVP